MKLAFWRREAEPQPQSGDTDLAAEWRAAVEREPKHLVVLPPPPDELQSQLYREVTIERDELLAALDERRPAPDPETLGGQLQAEWFRADGSQRSYKERWTAVAETAIDAVRGLWPTLPPAVPVAEHRDPHYIGWSEVDDLALLLFDAMQADVGRYVSWEELSADARRHFVLRAQHLLRSGRVLVAPPHDQDLEAAPAGSITSPGAPGQRLTPGAADRGGLGSATAPGDTNGSAAYPTAVEQPAPAKAPAAGSGGTEAAAPTTPAGPPPITADEERELAALIEADTELAAAAERGRASRPAAAASAAVIVAGRLERAERILDEHLERLAVRLAVTAGAVTSVTWNLMNESYREMYRVLATQVMMAGWLPPGTRSPAATRADIVAVLREHEWLDDDTCRCGWDESTCTFAPAFHLEHIAEHLIDAGVNA